MSAQHESVVIPGLRVLAWVIAVSMTVAFLLAHASFSPGLTLLFDNVQWTIAHVGAALLGWLGYRHSTAQERPVQRWFAIGLCLYALGQLIWDVQVLTGWQPFPAPSDIFYAAMGVCIMFGLWRGLSQRITAGRIRILRLDMLILLTQTLAMILLIYLGRAPAVSWLVLLQLSIYPVVMLGAVLIGLVMALELGLRPHWRWLLLLFGMAFKAAAWMQWNLIDLAGEPAGGTWLNYSFAVSSLCCGLGAACWRIDAFRSKHGMLSGQALHVVIPIVPVIAAVLSVFLVWSMPALPYQVRMLVFIGAATVIVLAVVRQSIGLAERERLLHAERMMLEQQQQRQAVTERFELAREAAELGVWEVDLVTYKGMWDRRMYRLFGLEPHTPGDPHLLWSKTVYPEDQQRVMHSIMSAHPGQPDVKMNFRVDWPNGKRVHLESFGRVSFDAANRHLRMTGVTWDVSERVHDRRALAESEAELRAIFENSMVGVVLIDEQGRFIRYNMAIERMFGYDLTQAANMLVDDVVHPDDLAESRQQFAAMLRNEVFVNQAERRYRHANGQYHWVRSSIYPVELRSQRYFVALVEDIQQRKEMQLALEQAQIMEQHLREEFTYSLLNVQEQERQRIANELHDSLGQSLSVIKNRAQLAIEKVSDGSAIATQLKGIIRVTDEAISETRRLAHNLRPLHIEQLGLTTALAQLVSEFEQATRIKIHSRLESLDDAFKPMQVTHIYRLVQEALNNISKHARATDTTVEAERDIHVVRLCIRDNGRGFDPQLMREAGLGLTSMMERAHMLGGKVEVHSTPGKGTTVAIELPIVEPEMAAGAWPD